MTVQTRIILDVDTGIDDAMAICYALGRPNITLEACTTVFGNTEVENATANTLALLDICGHSHVPVAQGVGRSLLKPYVKWAGHVHGENGIGEVILPEPPTKAVAEHAVDLIIRMAHENPGEITLCPVSPLTNIALAFAKDPTIAKKFREVVIMGSTLNHPGVGGPKSPWVDANFYNDPEAASIVINSGANLVLVGMDVTMQPRLTREHMNRIGQEGGHPAKTLMGIAEFYYNFYVGAQAKLNDGRPFGCGMHDPLAVAVAEDPSLVTMEAVNGRIELTGEWTRGQFIPDRRPIAAQTPNARVCTQVQVDQFLDRFCQAIISL